MNTNKKLYKIFDKKDFRYGDIVKWEGEEFFVYKQIAENILNCEGNSILTEMENVTLIQPAVTLSDVLAKMNERERYKTHQSYVYMISEEGKFYKCRERNRFASEEMEYICDWQLGKDLWSQSNKTQKSIVKILTGE